MSKEEWFRSWFDSPYYPILYRNRNFKEARQFIDALLSFLTPTPKTRFLDVACGRGRHSIYLNSLGYRVTGIDISENSIAEANRHASDTLHFHVLDMRETLNLQPVDVALNLFTSFGYFETREEHTTSLCNIYDVLQPGGVFVIDYLNTACVQRQLVHKEEAMSEGISFHITRELRNKHIIKTIRVTDGTRERIFEEKVMAFTQEDLEEMLTRVGFELEHRFGDYQLRPASVDDPRIIIIARKSR